MIGVGSDFQLRAMGPGGTSMLDRATASAKALGIKHRRRLGGSGSDHEAFENVGIPSVWLYRAEDLDYHTSRDRYENVSSKWVEAAGRLVLHMVAILAVEQWRKTPSPGDRARSQGRGPG
jgi:Zn-dependent M28 family amino/carboxypeptidase